MKDRTTSTAFKGPSVKDALSVLVISNSRQMRALSEDYLSQYGLPDPVFIVTYTQLMRSPLVSAGFGIRKKEYSHKSFVEEEGYRGILEVTPEMKCAAPLFWGLIVTDEGKHLVLTLAGVLYVLIVMGSLRSKQSIKDLNKMETAEEKEEYVTSIVFDSPKVKSVEVK